jgi:hypothetical protein
MTESPEPSLLLCIFLFFQNGVEQMIDRAIGLAGIAVSIIFGLLMVVFPKMSRKIGIAGFLLGVLLLGASIGIALLPETDNANQSTLINQGPGSALSLGQRGGVTAGSVSEAAPGSKK